MACTTFPKLRRILSDAQQTTKNIIAQIADAISLVENISQKTVIILFPRGGTSSIWRRKSCKSS